MRLAVFGAGGMGATHASAYAAFGKKERVEIEGIVRRSASKGRGAAERRLAAPDYQRGNQAAASGRLGRPRIAVARRLARPYWSSKRPRPFRVYGEPIVELSIHDFDAANWIMGRPRSVLAHGVSGSTGVTEHAMVAVEYRRGSAFVEGSAMMPPGFPFTTALRVQCDAGT